MTAAPKRLEKRRDHLLAHVVPVERALLERSKQLAEEAQLDVVPVRQEALLIVAEQFRLLAEELHWQP